MNNLSEEEQLKARIKELDELVDELTSILDLKKETIVEMQNAYETLNAHDEMLIATVDKLKEENYLLQKNLNRAIMIINDLHAIEDVPHLDDHFEFLESLKK